jgi:glucose-6-phosphate dehydrogenase assembly protein OpcA
VAGTVADRAWKVSTPEAIEADLAALWRELAGGDAPIARAVMSNLIVFRGRTTAAGADVADISAGLPLDGVAARHPSRMIVLEHCDDARPNAPLAAAVGIVTFGPPQARYGVEQIVMRSVCPDASLLSVLRRFVRGDLPTTVWCTDDLSEQPPPQPLLEVGRQLLYDSRRWRSVQNGVRALAAIVDQPHVNLADLNWRRLTPLRRVLADARGPLPPAAWFGVEATITHAAGEEAIAWLCAAWIRSETNGATRTIVAAKAGERDAVISVAFAGATATLTTKTVDVVSASAPPLSAGIRVETAEEAIAAELRSLSRDPALAAALKTLSHM